MQEMTSDFTTDNTIQPGKIAYYCFVSNNRHETFAPIWYYGSSIEVLYLLYNYDQLNVVKEVQTELRNTREFDNVRVKPFIYSRKDTKISSFAENIIKRAPVPEDSSEIIISVAGCSKPVYLSMILFSLENHASIILSSGSNNFKIFEDGYVRVQSFQNSIRWYLSHCRGRIFPRIDVKDHAFPESVLKDLSEMIPDYLMESTITGKNFTLNVDFAAVTNKNLILGKVFTEDGESFSSPGKIITASEQYFGKDCRMLIYAVGDSLNERLSTLFSANRNVTVINIPDPWSLAEYPEYFRMDLLKIIRELE